MYITDISLQNFRNYSAQSLSLCNGVNVVYGDNAQGKTNLVEAILVASCGKSHRAASDREMIKIGSSFADIEVRYVKDNMEQTNFLRMNCAGKKIIRLSGVPIKKMSQLMGQLNTVMFSPQDMNLVKEGPALRRRFIDMCISALRPKYLDALIRYGSALEQKSKLLRCLKENPVLGDTLDVWNMELASYGSIVMFYRQEYIQKLSPVASAMHMEISAVGEQMDMSYKPSCPVHPLCTAEQARQIFLEMLQKMKPRESACGLCLVGPHRDDIVFLVSGLSAKIYASQGQQRTIVLALKLSQMELFLDETGNYPVLLLDDITSELDSARRRYLFEKMAGRQVVITCTDPDRIDLPGGRFLKVESGEIHVSPSGQ